MISDLFIRRPILAMVVSIIILLLGVISIVNLPVSQYPEITPPTVQVSGSFIGADAQTVEQTVTTPVEVQINGTPGMTYLESSSTNNGSMTATVNFALGTDIDVATLDVQNRVSIAEPQLPQEVTRLGLTVRKRNPSLFMLVAIYSPNGTHDSKFLDNYASIYVKDALLRVDGVGDVFTVTEDFSMRLWLNPDKLTQRGITVNEVIAALQEQNVQVAAGAIGAPPQYNAQSFEYTVFGQGRLRTPEEFANVIVRTNPEDGSMVYVKDVARVELGKFTYGSHSLVDNKEASFMILYQSPGSNALSTADGIYEALDQLKERFPVDTDYVVPFESVSVVRVSISEVIDTLLIALALVILVIFFFLQSWRATVIAIVAIPVSIVGAFALFIPLGFTINTLTLFGFVLAIGIVVDDAIVVVEAVQNNLNNQKPGNGDGDGKNSSTQDGDGDKDKDKQQADPAEATRSAMKDISGPVIATALIMAAVFVPVGFIPGLTGRLYQQFAITIAISVLLSAVVALTLTPALCSLMLRPEKIDENSKGLSKFFYRFNTWFGRVTDRYTNGVKRSIKLSRYMLVALICIIAGATLLLLNEPTGFVPTEDEGRIFVTFELPEAASNARSIEVMQEMMDILDSIPAIEHYAAIAGLNVVTFSRKSNSGTIFLQLAPWSDRKEKSEQLEGLTARLNQQFATIIDANVVVIPPPSIPGLGSTSGFTFILQDKEGTSEISDFATQLQSFVGKVNQRPEIGQAFSFFTAQTPGYQLKVDREQAKQMGVSLTDIYSTVQTFLGSRYINDFTLYGRNFRVVAQADTAYRSNIGELDQYYVRNQAGDMVPLHNLVSYEVTESAPLISHYNLFQSATINGQAAPGYSSGEALTALEEVAAELPPSYGYEFSGLSREEADSGSTTLIIFGISVLFVFLFLAALYESWSVPFSVLLAAPLGIFGAMLALWLQPDINNNVYAQIGLITLIGLAAKNAILIVEYAKDRVDGGTELNDAIMQAVKLRLRPILMTSLAFILGMIPLVTASGAGAVSRQTIGWTVIGGMLAATFLAIFVVPVLYFTITKLAYGQKKLDAMQKQGSSS